MSTEKPTVQPRRGGSDLWKGHDAPIKTGPIEHLAALESVRWLTQTQYKMHRPDAKLADPNDVIRLLNDLSARFVLVGHHGISGWISEPRATRDVDVVVQKQHFSKALRVVHDMWPDLHLTKLPTVTRFVDSANDDPVIDLLRPVGVFREAFENCVRVGESYWVPNMELALASKFAAIVSEDRELYKKYRDAGEFYQIIWRNDATIDFQRLRLLGDAVQPGGAEKLLGFVKRVRAGRMLL